MQPNLTPISDELSLPEAKTDRCGVYGCINVRQPERDYCVSHTTPPSSRTCPTCTSQGRGAGAVFIASGVPVCGICGWGRSRVPKNDKRRKRR